MIIIKFADMTEEGDRRESVMGLESSIITMILLQLGYLVHSFSNYTMSLSIETSITCIETSITWFMNLDT